MLYRITSSCRENLSSGNRKCDILIGSRLQGFIQSRHREISSEYIRNKRIDDTIWIGKCRWRRTGIVVGIVDGVIQGVGDLFWEISIVIIDICRFSTLWISDTRRLSDIVVLVERRDKAILFCEPFALRGHQSVLYLSESKIVIEILCAGDKGIIFIEKVFLSGSSEDIFFFFSCIESSDSSYIITCIRKYPVFFSIHESEKCLLSDISDIVIGIRLSCRY